MIFDTTLLETNQPINKRFYLMLQLEDTKEKKNYIFPVHRWIWVEKHYYLYEFDAFLPQQDRQRDARNMELARKCKQYEYKETIDRGPKQVTKFHMITFYVALTILY
jgi:hypothetical protein